MIKLAAIVSIVIALMAFGAFLVLPNAPKHAAWDIFMLFMFTGQLAALYEVVRK